MTPEMKARLAKAKALGPNMNEAKTGGGGGDYEPPVEGKGCRLRLVSYVETGNHTNQTGKYVGKKKDKVELVWELSGKNWAPRDSENGKIPHRIREEMTYSLSENSRFQPLFKLMNACHGNEATIMAELLGKEFICDIVHSKGKDGRTYANIENLRKAERDSTGDGDMVPIEVDPPITELKMFVWNIATIEDWNSLYIEGEYPERKDDKGVVIMPAKSKNVLQDKIRSANNFQSLPCYDLIMSGASAEDEKSLDEALGGDDDAPPFVPDTAAGPANIDDCV